MRCARCEQVFPVGAKSALVILPGSATLVRVCEDDRLCETPKRPKPGHVFTAKMQRVREIARRYVTKEVG
jgi:hypothetical protein